VADHDRYAVLQNYSGFVSQEDGSPISIMSLATKKSQQLGSGDQATGDPAAAGVFTSIPAQAVATSGSIAVGTNGQWPDGKVVLRDAGKKDVLLGTAAQLDKAVHLRVGTPAYLFPVPDRAGDKIAIEIQPQVNSGSAGVVVVTRTGRVLYTIGGLGRSVSTSWSADGQALATVAQLPTGSELHIWRANAAASVQRFPGNADYGVFSWSPDGKWLLCAISGRNANGEHWVVASATGGPMIVTKGPGYPIAWLGA
jgi:hypothetical protein